MQKRSCNSIELHDLRGASGRTRTYNPSVNSRMLCHWATKAYWIRRRPTLPGRCQPSTISVLRLNFCVRYGNRWDPQAIVTGNIVLCRCGFHTQLCTFKTAQEKRLTTRIDVFVYFPSSLRFRSASFTQLLDQALDRLVSTTFIHYCTSSVDLSTSSSLRGLTCF